MIFSYLCRVSVIHYSVVYHGDPQSINSQASRPSSCSDFQLLDICGAARQQAKWGHTRACFHRFCVSQSLCAHSTEQYMREYGIGVRILQTGNDIGCGRWVCAMVNSICASIVFVVKRRLPYYYVRIWDICFRSEASALRSIHDEFTGNSTSRCFSAIYERNFGELPLLYT